MSTRGLYGFRVNGVDKVTYKHSDSYPSGLGVDICRALIDFFGSFDDGQIFPVMITHDMIKRIRKIARSIKLVNALEKPSYRTVYSLGGNGGETWGDVLRNKAGDIRWYTEKNLRYMVDDSRFLRDALFCEWVYIVNVDNMTLEVYTGVNSELGSVCGRYGDLTGIDSGSYRMSLQSEIPLEHVANRNPDDLKHLTMMLKDFEDPAYVAWVRGENLPLTVPVDKNTCTTIEKEPESKEIPNAVGESSEDPKAFERLPIIKQLEAVERAWYEDYVKRHNEREPQYFHGDSMVGWLHVASCEIERLQAELDAVKAWLDENPLS